jgi:hypothetical protein
VVVVVIQLLVDEFHLGRMRSCCLVKVVVVAGLTSPAMEVDALDYPYYQMIWIWLYLGTRASAHNDRSSLLYGTSSINPWYNLPRSFIDQELNKLTN